LRISSGIPARNAAATSAESGGAARRPRGTHQLLEEVLVIDDRFEDDTAALAAAAGVRVLPFDSVAPLDTAPECGKGTVTRKGGSHR
jgi:hypothetical protein